MTEVTVIKKKKKGHVFTFSRAPCFCKSFPSYHQWNMSRSALKSFLENLSCEAQLWKCRFLQLLLSNLFREGKYISPPVSPLHTRQTDDPKLTENSEWDASVSYFLKHLCFLSPLLLWTIPVFLSVDTKASWTSHWPSSGRCPRFWTSFLHFLCDQKLFSASWSQWEGADKLITDSKDSCVQRVRWSAKSISPP